MALSGIINIKDSEIWFRGVFKNSKNLNFSNINIVKFKHKNKMNMFKQSPCIRILINCIYYFYLKSM